MNDNSKKKDEPEKKAITAQQSNSVEAEASSSKSQSPQPGPSSQHITFSDLKKVQLITDEDIQYFLEDNAYAVIPLSDCPHLPVVQSVPIAGINISAPCAKCGSTQENWLCLTCYAVYCSRYVNQHMLEHTQTAFHPIALSFSDISVWCYSCDDYVENEVLYSAKNLVHQAKFGTAMGGLNQNTIRLT